MPEVKKTKEYNNHSNEKQSYCYARFLFIKSLAIIFFFAFISLFIQILGLIGSEGILPASDFLNRVSLNTSSYKYFATPTIFWINCSDLFLQGTVICGIVLSVFLFFEFYSNVLLFILWFLYLSFSTVGQSFMSFQWDNLLLETAFLGIILTPLKASNSFREDTEPSKIIIVLFRLLLFKLMFLSGFVKVFSGDKSWTNFTALTYHYETQPLPTWIGYYFHQLPKIFHIISCLYVLMIELFTPFFIFGKRTFKILAFYIFLALQTLIFLTGNYCFFNLLSVAISLFLLDDAHLKSIFSKTSVEGEKKILIFTQKDKRTKLINALSIFVLIFSCIGFFRFIGVSMPASINHVYKLLIPFRTINNYGLFAVMTKRRLGISIEGSNDGTNWFEYKFKYKPLEFNKTPSFIEPLQPRLDWQMWFAALSNYESNPWFIRLCVRLLQGSDNVLDLFNDKSSIKNPPKFIRAILYDYKVTTLKEKSTLKNWWKRAFVRIYLPPVYLNNGNLTRVNFNQ